MNAASSYTSKEAGHTAGLGEPFSRSRKKGIDADEAMMMRKSTRGGVGGTKEKRAFTGLPSLWLVLSRVDFVFILPKLVRYLPGTVKGLLF